MISEAPHPLTPQHDEIARLMGRCVLRLQQYEHLLKAILARHKIETADGKSNLEKRVKENGGKTLGMLVKELFGTVIISNEQEKEEAKSDRSSVSGVRVRTGMVVPDKEYEQLKGSLAELVELRNKLVHHFAEQHDPLSLDGCLRAQEELSVAYKRIGEFCEQLRQWGLRMDESRFHVVQFLESDAGRNWFLNSIAPDATVYWPDAEIVRALRQATDELAEEGGWTSVAAAEKWMQEHHPEQTPEKYGCRSLQQVIQESSQFKHKHHDINGQRTAVYQAKKQR